VVAGVVARAALSGELVGRFRCEAATGLGLTEPMRVAIAMPRNPFESFAGADCCAGAMPAQHAPSSTRARASPRRPC
jgi:hypothetical protein